MKVCRNCGMLVERIGKRPSASFDAEFGNGAALKITECVLNAGHVTRQAECGLSDRADVKIAPGEFYRERGRLSIQCKFPGSVERRRYQRQALDDNPKLLLITGDDSFEIFGLEERLSGSPRQRQRRQRPGNFRAKVF